MTRAPVSFCYLNHSGGTATLPSTIPPMATADLRYPGCRAPPCAVPARPPEMVRGDRALKKAVARRHDAGRRAGGSTCAGAG
jgi:hypothetical protein